VVGGAVVVGGGFVAAGGAVERVGVAAQVETLRPMVSEPMPSRPNGSGEPAGTVPT